MLLNFVQKRCEFFLPDYNLSFSEIDDLAAIDLKNVENQEVVVALNLMNPILDESLLTEMIAIALRKGGKVVSDGHVPGAAPVFVAKVAEVNEETKIHTAYSDMQRKYNSQLNLARLRRIKLFQALLKRMPNLPVMKLTEILDYFGGKEGTEFIAAYGEDVKMDYLDTCPLCKSNEFSPVYADIGQPLTGFLTRFSKYYFLCHDCGLCFANPRMSESELWRYYDRFSYDSVWNAQTLKEHYSKLDHLNTSHFYNYVAVLPYLRALPQNAACADLGGGDGEFVVFLRQNFKDFKIELWDYRISPLIDNALQAWDVSTKQMNFLNEEVGKECLDLVSNWEVIEHLPVEKLENYFTKIYASLKKGGLYCFSTPDFDNPYTHGLDFWAITPGEHLSVLSRRVLEPILIRCGFKIIAEHHECVSMKTKDRWYKYGAECNSFRASRAEAMIINDFLRDEKILEDHLQFMRKNNLGSELILCCQK